MTDRARNDPVLEPHADSAPPDVATLQELIYSLATWAGSAVAPVDPPDALGLLLAPPERAVSPEMASRIARLRVLPKKFGERARSDGTPRPSTKRTGLEDPGVGQLHPESALAYRNGNAAYLALKNPKYQFIGITSGRRTTAQQFKFYSEFVWWKIFGGQPKANPADIPGRSIHEYGFAIDVVHKADSRRLKQSLEANNWKATHASEPWHYDATGAPSWSRLKAFIGSTATSPSDELVDHLMAMLKARKLYEGNEPEYERKRKLLKPELDRLEAERKELMARLVKLQREQRRLQAEQEWLANSQRRLEEMRRQYQQMTYNACPNGQSYADCTYSALKQQYDRDKAALARKINDLGLEIAARRERYTYDMANHDINVRQYDNDKRAYDSSVATFREKHAAFFRLHDQMVSWKETFSSEEIEVNRLVSTIASIVGSFS